MSRRLRSSGGAVKRLGSLVAIGLLSLGIVSCGGGGGSEAQQAESAVVAYLHARAGGDWSKACSYLAQSTRSVLERVAARTERSQGKGCARLIETSTKRLSPGQRAGLAKADVISVRLREGRGYVRFREPDGGEGTVAIKSEGGDWKIAGGITRLAS